MKIGIMQPYFFPYIGYFQLIHSVDVYVNLDHVNFMKGTYMTRNELKNGIKIHVPIKKSSQNKKCSDSFVLSDLSNFKKFKKTLHTLYGKENEFEKKYNLLFEDTSVWTNELTISQFNLHFIKKICIYLDINTYFIDTSEGLTTNSKSKGIQDIVKKISYNYKNPTYINAIGGIKLYDKKDFESSEIDLKFIEMGDINLDNKFNSILDLIFRYEKDIIVNQIKNYKLI